MVNETYPVEFYDGQVQKPAAMIDADAALSYLNGQRDLLINATIKIEGVIVKCYFFAEQEIENDIDPREITSIEDHNRLIAYMKSVSKCLQKPVILTDENVQNVVHILVDEDKVELVFN